MRIDPKIALKHWHEAVVEQVTQEYRENGYDVQIETMLGSLRADIVARRDEEVIVFELKSNVRDSERSKKAAFLRNQVVHELGGQFKLIFVSPPRDVNIEISGLEEILCGLLSENASPLNDLATHTQIEEVDGIEISSISVSEDEIYLEGEATVYIELQYGSNSDNNRGDGARIDDSFPFKFKIKLDASLSTIDVESIEVDTSSFYQ